jgi:hypothetical protein
VHLQVQANKSSEVHALRRHWMHSEMWWPRLFAHHAPIAWDDYEKDYSDLPNEVLAPHRAAELARDAVRRVEAAEKDKREVLQARSMRHCHTVTLCVVLTN